MVEGQAVLAQVHHITCTGDLEGSSAKVGQGYQSPANKMGCSGKGVYLLILTPQLMWL